MYSYSHNCSYGSTQELLLAWEGAGRKISVKTFLAYTNYNNEMYGFTREDILSMPHGFDCYWVKRKGLDFMYCVNSSTDFIFTKEK